MAEFVELRAFYPLAHDINQLVCRLEMREPDLCGVDPSECEESYRPTHPNSLPLQELTLLSQYGDRSTIWKYVDAKHFESFGGQPIAAEGL